MGSRSFNTKGHPSGEIYTDYNGRTRIALYDGTGAATARGAVMRIGYDSTNNRMAAVALSASASEQQIIVAAEPVAANGLGSYYIKGDGIVMTVPSATYTADYGLAVEGGTVVSTGSAFVGSSGEFGIITTGGATVTSITGTLLGTYANDLPTYGQFSSVTAGPGIKLSSTKTAALRVYTDDGGAAATGSIRAILGRFLATIDHTGSLSARGVMGHVKQASGIDYSSANSRVFGVEGYIEQAGNSSYSGQTAGLRGYLDADTNNITAATGSYVGGVISELRCTGTLTATGKVAAFIARATSNEASYNQWPMALYAPGTEVDKGVVIGASANTHGSGVVLSSTNTYANGFFADDNNTAATGSLRNVLARTLLSVDHTGALSVRSLMGQIKFNSGIDTSSTNARVFGVEGFIEFDGDSSVAGQCAAVRAYVDTNAHNMTTAGSSYSGGVIAELRDTGTPVNTGVRAAYIALATSNESGYNSWPYGVYAINTLQGAYFSSNSGNTGAADKCGVQIAHTGTLSNASGGLVGLEVKTTLLVSTKGIWSTGIFASVTENTAECVNGYTCGAEFENNIGAFAEANLHDWCVLGLNANDDHTGAQSQCAYIWLREYGTNACNAIFRFFDITAGTTSTSTILAANTASTHTNSIRFLVGSTPYYIMCTNTVV